MSPNNKLTKTFDTVQVNKSRSEEEREIRFFCGNNQVSSLVDELLCDIYGKAEIKRKVSTTCELSWVESDSPTVRWNRQQVAQKLLSKDVKALHREKSLLEKLLLEEGNKLVKHLKRKDFLVIKRDAQCDVITALIQAASPKTREDTKMKFSLSPGGETGFSQWLDAMKMVAQLPGGMPPEFRTKLWLQLSEKHLNDQNIDWEKAEAVIFNEWTNPDDEELGVQIVKDLHRTGCSLFCGAQEHNQALLKRVLLAYARWNKSVGYCQGFNMLAALILQVMDRDEKNAVKVMIYLIEGVLPESYFANNLRGLSVDMAVFRDLLKMRLPKLSKHLEALQHDTTGGTSYEPPLTNVFTMQWFLTLFSNCLPQQTVLRVWDLVFLHGNEVLLRTALAIWGILQDRIITVESADEFYSIMGVVTREMLEFGLMDANNLVKMIIMVDPFPNELQELREKYLYNISPWTQSVQTAAKKGIKLFYSDPEDQDDTEDEDKIALATAYGVFRRRESTSKELQTTGPTLDISVLKQQYAKLRQRQRQAHIIISAACSSNLPSNITSAPSVSVNHLLMGKSALVNKGRRIGPPEGSIPPPKNRKGDGSKKQKVVISGETLQWKDTERRGSKVQMKNNSNSNSESKVITSKKHKMESCNGKQIRRNDSENKQHSLNTNHDRTEAVTEKTVEESFKRKESKRSSSSSSSSTELCDDEFHRYSDFDSEEATNSDASSYNFQKKRDRDMIRFDTGFSDSVKEVRILTENLTTYDSSESDIAPDMDEIRKCAVALVEDIEERLQHSDRLKNAGMKTLDNLIVSEKTSSTIDNTVEEIVPLLVEKDILKPEPEVPIFDKNVIQTSDRRKSELASNVIKENLEMLHKFAQKKDEEEKPPSPVEHQQDLVTMSASEKENEKEVVSKEEIMQWEKQLEKTTPDETRDSREFEEGESEKHNSLVAEEVCLEEKEVAPITAEEEVPVEMVEMVEMVNDYEEGNARVLEEDNKLIKQSEVVELIFEVSKYEEEEKILGREEESDRNKNEDEVKKNGNPSPLIEVEKLIEETKPSLEQDESKLPSPIIVKPSGQIEDVKVAERDSEKRNMPEEEKCAIEEKASPEKPQKIHENVPDLPAQKKTRVGEEENNRKEDIQEWKRKLVEIEKEVKQEIKVISSKSPERVKQKITVECANEEKEIVSPRKPAEKVEPSEESEGEKVAEEILSPFSEWKLRELGKRKEDEVKGVRVVEGTERCGKVGGKDFDILDEEVSARRTRLGDWRKEESLLPKRWDRSWSPKDEHNRKDVKYRDNSRSVSRKRYQRPKSDGTDSLELVKSSPDRDSIYSRNKSPLLSSPEESKRDFFRRMEPEGRSEFRFRSEDIAERSKKESEQLKNKIEMSKSDWELKMKRIAELESTTREKLSEMQAKSEYFRKRTVHRSLDRCDELRKVCSDFSDGTYTPRRARTRSPSYLNQDSSEVHTEGTSRTRWRKSALSFDEITSRTQKLLQCSEMNKSVDEKYFPPKSPEIEYRKPKDSTLKFKQLIEESYGEGEIVDVKPRKYEYYSSPTSPEYRRIKYSEYVSPKKYLEPVKKYQEEDETEDWLKVTQESSRLKVEMINTDSDPPYSKSSSNFSPFPTRSPLRPKELGVRLGMYPPPSEGQLWSKKS